MARPIPIRAVGLLLAGLLAALPVLGGCADSQVAESSAGSASASQQSSASESAASSSQASSQTEPAGDNILRVARGYEDSYSMDPHTWPSCGTVYFGLNTFETLIVLDENLDYAPRLAESWEISEDGLSYLFHLRKGVQFHYGYGEMKASDVVFSFNRIREVGQGTSATKLNMDNVESVTALDDYTVEFKLKSIDLSFLFRLAYYSGVVVSEKAVEERGEDGFGKQSVGTGPYALVEGVAGDHTVLTRFDDYWGGKPQLDGITFTIITEPATLFNAFEAGEIDFFEITDTQKLLEYKDQPDQYSIYSVPSSQYCYVGMNFDFEPFDDLRVRQAVAYGIDRQEICDNYFMGLEQPGTSIIAPYNTMYIVGDNFHYDYDLDKAKALLAEAGYPDGFETQFWCPNDPVSVGPATVVQTYLTAMGIRAELQAVDFGVFMDTAKSGQCPMWLFYSSPETIPDEFFRGKTSAQAPGNNYSMFRDEEYDKAVEQALSATDEETKAEYLAVAQERLAEQIPFIPVATYTQNYVMSNRVKNFKLEGYTEASFREVYIEN